MLAIFSHYYNVFLRILAKLYNSVIAVMARTSWREAFYRLWEGYIGLAGRRNRLFTVYWSPWQCWLSFWF